MIQHGDHWRKIVAVESDSDAVTEIDKNIFLIPGQKGGGGNVFVLKGSQKIALIDIGMAGDHDFIRSSLHKIGLGFKDIHMVLLTHEHVDHVGGVPLIPRHIIVAAHARAADKIRLNDQFSVMSGAFQGGLQPFHVDIQLDEGVIIDLGGIRLRVLYTPGHCSGAVAFYETERGTLFVGDTVFADGILGGIFSSGNISDYISSLERMRELRLLTMYPGHGKMSPNPMEDLNRAIAGARALMNDTRHLFDSIQVGSSFKQIVKATATYSRRAANRRKYPRFPTHSEAVIHWVDHDEPVVLVDASMGGLRLNRVIDQDPGTTLAVTIQGVGRLDYRVIKHLQGNTRLEFSRSVHDGGSLMAWIEALANNAPRKK